MANKPNNVIEFHPVCSSWYPPGANIPHIGMNNVWSIDGHVSFCTHRGLEPFWDVRELESEIRKVWKDGATKIINEENNTDVYDRPSLSSRLSRLNNDVENMFRLVFTVHPRKVKDAVHVRAENGNTRRATILLFNRFQTSHPEFNRDTVIDAERYGRRRVVHGMAQFWRRLVRYHNTRHFYITLEWYRTDEH